MRFKYLDHTADVKFQAYGSSLEEAFINSVLAAVNTVVDIDSVKPKIKQTIRLKEQKLMTLLYEFLESVIISLDVDGYLPCRFERLSIVETDEGFELDAAMSGDHAKNYETKGDIKAMTYSDMKIEKKADGYMIQVVLDI
jgi:SHS2 domain-containing protein